MGKFVKVTKQSTINESNHGIFDGYMVEGFLIEEPKVGYPLSVLRTNRNGVHRLGVFETSEIKNIELSANYSILYTRNSVYKIEYMEIDYEYCV